MGPRKRVNFESENQLGEMKWILRIMFNSLMQPFSS